jgi:hypothetical protein
MLPLRQGFTRFHLFGFQPDLFTRCWQYGEGVC